MNTESIQVKAKLTLYLTDISGRITGILNGYRPNHVFEYDKRGYFKQTYIGQITFDEGICILPGESSEVTVDFLILFDVVKFLTIGRKWWIHEANNKIGEAVIIDIKR